MRKMLWLTLEFPPTRGGIAVYIKQICHALGGDAVTVLAPSVRGDLHMVFKDQEEPYTIVRKSLLFPRFLWPRWMRAFWQTLRLLKKQNVSLLMTSHVLPLGYALFLFHKLKKMPYWINVHGLDVLAATRSKWKTFWLKKILRSAERVVVNSEFTGRAVRQLEVVAEGAITIVYPCPDEVQNVPPDVLQKYRYTYALDGKRVVLSLGRLVMRKGFFNVIRAFQNVVKQIPQAVYLIAGDGEEAANLERLIVELQLQNNVRMLGAVSNKDRARLYQVADIFVMPTVTHEHDVEGFGIVYLEAAAYGLPVIATNAGGAAEAVVHGSTGLLLESGDRTSLEKALVTLLTDEPFRTRLGQAGKERVAAEFVWKDQVAKLKPYLD